jgi:hypothetical protein
MAASFSRTASLLTNLRRRTPLDRDLVEASTAEVIDTFYVSEDPTRVIQDSPPLLNADNYVRRADLVAPPGPLPAFELPSAIFTGSGSSYAGGYEMRTFPILRYNARGVLDWRFGYATTDAQLIARDSAEILTLQTTRFLPTLPGERTVIQERLHVVGPGGGDIAINDHQVIASAAYEVTAGAELADPQNGAIVYRVERATGFWARATNVVMIRFDDPSHPDYLLREVHLLRGVGN